MDEFDQVAFCQQCGIASGTNGGGVLHCRRCGAFIAEFGGNKPRAKRGQKSYGQGKVPKLENGRAAALQPETEQIGLDLPCA